MTAPTTPQIDNDVYNRLADTWWDEKGLLNILKATVNPWRVPYFQRILTRLQIDPKGKRALDVGCGGGLLAEEFATMGFAVTGIDPSETSLAVARAPLTLHILSSEPCTTSVGTSSKRSLAVRSPDAIKATAWRAMPSRSYAPKYPRPARTVMPTV